MRLPRLAKLFRRRVPIDGLTTAVLARMARSPSYRAPAAADVHDIDAVRPPDALSSLADFGAKDVVVRDGVVVGLSLSGRAFISNGAALLRAAPLTDLRLVAVQPYMGELARCPHLAAIRRLDISGNRIGAAGVRELAGSAYLGGLRELVLSGNDLGSSGIAALRAAAWLPNLVSLDLADNGIGAEEVAALLAAVPNVVALALSRNPIGPAGAAALSASDLFTRVQRLAFSRCDLGAAGVRSLVSTNRSHSLIELDLSFNAIGPDGAAALAAASLPALRDLNFGFNDIEDAGAAALASSRTLAALVALDLTANRLTAAPHFDAVEQLILTANPVAGRFGTITASPC